MDTAWAILGDARATDQGDTVDIALAASGDGRAFERLYRRHVARVHTLAQRLVGAELAFRRDGHLVMQIQMAKAVETVPLTRDYITDWERAATADAAKASLAAN